MSARRHKAVETGTSITEVSSYGEPWVVEHEQADAENTNHGGDWNM